MIDKTYTKFEIAVKQLETAVILFLNGKSRSSVITLAGAAGNILSQLVRNSGQEPFIDYACRVHNEISGFTPPRQKYNYYIDRKLGITDHKHMSDEDPEYVKLDLDRSAADSLIRALSDYITLNGKEDNFVKAFFSWAWKNMDGQMVMEDYKNISKKLKK